MTVPGPRNLITDVDGIRVGHAEDAHVRTGVTVVLADAPFVAGVDVGGGAPGTRETDSLDPACLVDQCHAVVLSGGSVFGLAAADAVTNWLSARGIGLALGVRPVPVVPGAVLYDLANGGDKDWGEVPPYYRLGGQACAAAGAEFALGNAGAGLGARAGPVKGGLGSASAVTATGLQVGALFAVNSWGSPVVPGQRALWAWALEQDGEFGGLAPPHASVTMDAEWPEAGPLASHTTIGVIATNAVLDKAQARRVAIIAQDGIARAIRPAHTPFDGDTVFVISTARQPLEPPGPEGLARLGSLAADCAARAIARGVFYAESLGDLTAFRDLAGG